MIRFLEAHQFFLTERLREWRSPEEIELLNHLLTELAYKIASARA